MKENNKIYSKEFSPEVNDYRPKKFKYEHRGENNRKKKNQLILPSAATLRAYEELSAGAADRLIEMAEIEQNHRHELEEETLRLANINYRIGQSLSALIIIIIIAMATYFANILNNQVLSLTILISGFTLILVGMIIANKNHRQYLNQNKRYKTQINKNESS